MLTVGDKLPALTVPVQQGTPRCPRARRSTSAETNGKWKILFYWPKDFTFVCPTEIVGYGELEGRLRRPRRRPDRRLDRHQPRPLRLAQVGRAARRRRLPVDRRQQQEAGRGARHPRTPTRASPIARPSSSIPTMSSSTSRSTASTSAATRPRRCACSTRCRPTSCARATGAKAKRCCARRREPPSPARGRELVSDLWRGAATDAAPSVCRGPLPSEAR